MPAGTTPAMLRRSKIRPEFAVGRPVVRQEGDRCKTGMPCAALRPTLPNGTTWTGFFVSAAQARPGYPRSQTVAPLRATPIGPCP